jgi:hypothetical protein
VMRPASEPCGVRGDGQEKADLGVLRPAHVHIGWKSQTDGEIVACQMVKPKARQLIFREREWVQFATPLSRGPGILVLPLS